MEKILFTPEAPKGKFSQQELDDIFSDQKLLNKLISQSKGIIDLSITDIKSPYVQQRYNNLVHISPDVPTTYNKNELETLATELENILQQAAGQTEGRGYTKDNNSSELDKPETEEPTDNVEKVEDKKEELVEHTEDKKEDQIDKVEDKKEEVGEVENTYSDYHQFLKKVQEAKLGVVNVKDIAEGEARKAADAYMTEQKGKAGFFKKLWKHTLFDEYYRQRQINRTRKEILESDNIYAGRLGADDNLGHKEAMKAITDRFIADYEGTLSEGEDKKILNNQTPESVKVTTEIKKLILDYAQGLISDEVFKSEKIRLIDSIKDNQLLAGSNAYADNLFEVAQNAKLAIEHGAKAEELKINTDLIIGKAKSSLKTEAHLTWVDKGTDWLKKTKVGRVLSPAVLSTAVGIAYCASTKFLGTKGGGLLLGLGGAVAVSSTFAGLNESQRVALERGQHGIEMAEGQTFEKGSQRREQMDSYQYKMVKSRDLLNNLKQLLVEKNQTGEEVFKKINKEDLDGIYEAISNIESRTALNSQKKIDLIAYEKLDTVEKERTELTILLAKAKVHLRKTVDNDLKDSLPAGETFDTYLKKQTEAAQLALLDGENGVTAQDKAFLKYKRKRVAKKVAQTMLFGLAIGTTIQEAVALKNDDVQGIIEGIKGEGGDSLRRTPLEYLRQYLAGEFTGAGADGSADINLDSNLLNNSEGTIFNTSEGAILKTTGGLSIIEKADGTFDILKNGQLVNNLELTFDPDGKLDAESIIELGQSGIVVGNTETLTESTTEVVKSAQDYLTDNPEGSQPIGRAAWYDNNTVEFDKNELRLLLGGVNGSGIDANGDIVLDVSKMTADGSFHGDLSINAPEATSKGLLKIIFSLSQDTQNQVFELPINADGQAIIDQNSDLAKLFFDVENGKLIFKGRFAEVVQSLGASNGKEQVISLATMEGPGRDAIKDVVTTVIKENVNHLAPLAPENINSQITEAPWFIPVVARKPLEKLQQVGGYYDESYLDRDSLYEDPVYMDEKIQNSTYEESAYLDDKIFDDKPEKASQEIDEQAMRKNIEGMKDYVGKKMDLMLMEKLNQQIAEPMDKETKISIVLPCYKEGDNVYKTLVDWTDKQQDLKPEELEIIAFVNAPKGDQPLDEKTIAEIKRFQKDHPKYKVKLVQHNFNFSKNRKMGAIYKAPTDLALYRNLKRLEEGASEKTVSQHLLRSGGADALGRNPRFLREIIDFMDKHPNTEQLRTQSAYPPEVRQKFPLFNAITVFNHSLSMLYTKGESNIGLGTYRSRAYAQAGGFDQNREYREEIDLGSRIRQKYSGDGEALKKLVKKNAIDNPRRELFALAKGDTVLRAYADFSSPKRDAELRKFNWDKLSSQSKNNIELNLDNLNREFDAYFQHYLKKTAKESGIISNIITGKLNSKTINSKSLHPETRLFLTNPEIRKILNNIDKNKPGLTRTSPEIMEVAELLNKMIFNRILRTVFGLVEGEDKDYYYKESANKINLNFTKRAIDKLNKASKRKWKNFDGYWPEEKK